MAEIMHFRGMLPPSKGGSMPPFDGGFVLPADAASPGGPILAALDPFRGDLEAALARDDQQSALRIAYGALSRVAEALASFRGDQLRTGQARIHALVVQLRPLPLESLLDGTLRETGTEIEVSYRNWTVERAEAAAWGNRLAQRFQELWPGAWVVVSR